MQLIFEKAEAYSKAHTSPLEQLLLQNEESTFQNHPHAQMHSGHVQGKFLEFISRMLKPVKILEIGTFTGFSALCLVKGLVSNGILHTIELRKDDADNAQRYFDEANEKRIVLHIGDALSIIPSLSEKWDLVYIDADKINYIEYYELTLQSLNVGGYIIADNVLFHGEVLSDEIKGKNAKAIAAFNKHILKDTRVEQVLLTVRDGLMLIRKL